ncbi:MAG: corrinoid protein [Anaerolineae bacterium]|nr:corrinoid protein [Anaerolineae bacterium]
MTDILKTIFESVLVGNKKGVSDGVQQAVDAGVDAGEILNKGLIAAMSEVGRRFEEGEYFVPEMLIAARAMSAGMEIIKPLLVKAGVETIGKVAIGTVKGDLHDIGKNLVGMMMEGAGFEVIDLGVDVTPDRFVEAARSGVNIIAMSALLTTTIPSMEATIKAIEVSNLRDSVRILVGGAPVTQAYAEKIGADGYAADASAAARKALEIVGRS